MPELPEVETVRRGLAPALVGARFTRVEQRRPDLRFPFPARFSERLVGRSIEALGRRAKYLIADLDDGSALVMHLGMSGSFRIAEGTALTEPGLFHHERSKDPAHDHVVFHLSNGARIAYNDPRRFGFMELMARADLSEHKLFRDIGLEPLGNSFDSAALAARLAGKNAPLKAALLDQSVVAGLGNIYVCEALHRAHLSPRRTAGALARRDGAPTARADLLVQCIRDVLNEAIEAGGSSLRDHRLTDGSLGYFQHRFRVYDREGEPCPTPGCGGTIQRIVQAGRSTFFCGRCQK
jgi:formamidopyrimidine-DNA glycosylase